MGKKRLRCSLSSAELTRQMNESLKQHGDPVSPYTRAQSIACAKNWNKEHPDRPVPVPPPITDGTSDMLDLTKEKMQDVQYQNILDDLVEMQRFSNQLEYGEFIDDQNSPFNPAPTETEAGNILRHAERAARKPDQMEPKKPHTTSKPLSSEELIEQARRGHLASKIDNPYLKKKADAMSRRLGHIKYRDKKLPEFLNEGERINYARKMAEEQLRDYQQETIKEIGEANLLSDLIHKILLILPDVKK